MATEKISVAIGHSKPEANLTTGRLVSLVGHGPVARSAWACVPRRATPTVSREGPAKGASFLLRAGGGAASGAALPTPSSLGPSLEAAASLSRVRAAATWAARARKAESRSSLVISAPVGVADGFKDPRATPVAMLSPWTWFAESHGVVTLWTPNCVSMRGQF